MKTYEEMAQSLFERRREHQKTKEHRNKTYKKRAIVGTFAMAMLAAVLIPSFYYFGGGSGGNYLTQTDVNGKEIRIDTRKRNSLDFGSEQRAIIWTWDEKYVYEQFPEIVFQGISYTCRGREISVDLLDESSGQGMAYGQDPYTDQNHQSAAQVFGIKGLPRDEFVAVKYSGSDLCYVCKANNYTDYKTFGEFVARYNLRENLPLTAFSYNYGGIERGNFVLTEAENGHIWELLAKVYGAEAATSTGAEAPSAESQEGELISPPYIPPGTPIDTSYTYYYNTEHITFSASSASLGIENRAFTVNAEGYLLTNVADYGYAYYIGEDAAREIIDYAMAKGEKDTQAQSHVLIGQITKIGQGYFLLDDKTSMKNPEDGRVFKIAAEELRISRVVKMLKVGDMVMVSFDGIIYAGEPDYIHGVSEVQQGSYFENGDFMIEE